MPTCLVQIHAATLSMSHCLSPNVWHITSVTLSMVATSHTEEATSLTTCRPDYVVDNTFELFCDLEASDEQCDFPVVYASGVQGIAGDDPKNMADTLAPLFDTIVREIKPPLVKIDAPLQLLVGSDLSGLYCELAQSASGWI